MGSLVFILFVVGEETHPLGFLSLHYAEADLHNLHVWENSKSHFCLFE